MLATRDGHGRSAGSDRHADDDRVARLLPCGPVEWVAEGGMALVYRGHDDRGRPVAIKVLRSALVGHAEVRAAFAAEHAILCRIAHPGVIAALGQGEVDGVPYLVLEWCDGQNLADAVAFEPMAVRRVAAVGAALASALDASHAAGVVHCDVKPANVILGPGRNEVRLVDFGVARLLGASSASDLVVGTPSYMAPEAWSGAAAPASDVYSLGCVLYELVAGAPPFQGSMADVMWGHRDDPPPAVAALRPDLPAELATLIMEMLAKSPEHRPTMASVAMRLAALTTPRPVTARRARAVALAAVPAAGGALAMAS